MIAVDANVLVYAHRPDSDWHGPAVAAVRTLAESGEPWALPWPCLHEFYAVVTNKRLYGVPTPPDRAIDQIKAWLESGTVRLVSESQDHFERLAEFATRLKITGSQVHDAKIAAICLGHGVRELLTLDRDFSRYPGLKTRSLIA